MQNNHNYIELIYDNLSIDQAIHKVSSNSVGAISSFIGTTRDTFESKRVIRLEYEAYIPMAIKSLQQLCQLIRSKWNLINISIQHRLGIVPIAEASVIIVISSAHRRDSLEAVHFAIDHLKATVPIWKKEFYEDGSSWKQNTEFQTIGLYKHI
eukprot:TRINITY_DN1627_c1_g1_i1.p1 TRINITY_DN1627_c1_g1~~TRINITY_DN1627_c1_g1_i1.p1  ORF type:complete len:153 (+),score=66.08 TRINITY_DN1627_c1_g1_i1:113-571(+)